MDEAEAQAAVEKLVAELREARIARDDALRRIAGLRKLVEGYLELYPLLDDMVEPGDLDDEDDNVRVTRPRGADAALSVLTERRGEWYQVPVIVDFLDNEGWMPRSSNPRNAVRTALERLVENGAVEKGNAAGSGAVIYRVPPPDTDPANYDPFGEEPF